MRQRQTLAAILAVGILFVSPIAWGCEGRGQQDCSMSECPMTDQQMADACHDSEASLDHGASNCDTGLEVGVACCGVAVDPEPAKVDSASLRSQSASPLIILAEQLELRPPARPPDLISEAISSQQHELGRFTLLSSFLL